MKTELPADMRSKHFGNNHKDTGSNDARRFLDKVQIVFAVFTTMELLPSLIWSSTLTSSPYTQG